MPSSDNPTVYFLDLGSPHPDPTKPETLGRLMRCSPSSLPSTSRAGSDGYNTQTPETILSGIPTLDGIAILPPSTTPASSHETADHGTLFLTSMGSLTLPDGAIYALSLPQPSASSLSAPTLRTLIPRSPSLTTCQIHTPKQLALDPVDRKLYFCDREGLRVMRCSLDGSELDTLVRTGDWRDPAQQRDRTRWCVGIALDLKSRMFYWTQKGPSAGREGRVCRAGMDYQPRTTAEDWTTAVDEDGDDKEAWCTKRTDIECLFSGLPEPVDLAVDDDAGVLYWTDRALGMEGLGNTLNRARVPPRPSTTSSVRGDASLATVVAAAVGASGITTRSADVLGYPTPPASGATTPRADKSVAARPGVDYEVVASGFRETIGVVLDKKNGHIYVTDLGGTLYRMDMEDGGNRVEVCVGQGRLAGIAVA